MMYSTLLFLLFIAFFVAYVTPFRSTTVEVPQVFPSPITNRNSYQGLTHQTTCADSDDLITHFWWQVIMQKHQQFKIIKDKLHPLIISPQVNNLAFNHSYSDMFKTGTINSRGYFQRRLEILRNAETWFSYPDLTPDPKYPPLGITSIDEVYGAGNNPSVVWKYMLDYAYDVIAHHHHTFIGVGVYCQPLPDKTFSTVSNGVTTVNHAAYWWVTLILIGTCGSDEPNELYFKNTAETEYPYFCCDYSTLAPQYDVCFNQSNLETLDKDFSVELIVNTTNGPEAVCCDFIPLNGNNSVPAVDTPYTGVAIATTYFSQTPGYGYGYGYDVSGSTCFCVNYTVPTKNQPTSPVDTALEVTGVGIHFGRRGQESETTTIFAFPAKDYHNQDFRDCWNWGADGLCLENIFAGNFYISVHNQESEPNSLIRGQIDCVSPDSDVFGPSA